MRFRGLLAAAAVVVAGWPGVAAAALPPIHNRVSQLRAVLETDGLAQAMAPYGLIDRIEHVDDFRYRVWALECFVDVILEPVAPPGGPIGPTGYEGRLGEVSCR